MLPKKAFYLYIYKYERKNSMNKKLFNGLVVIVLMATLITGCASNTPEAPTSSISPETSNAPTVSQTPSVAPSVSPTVIIPQPSKQPVSTSDDTSKPVGSLPQFAQDVRPYDACVLDVPNIYREESYDFSDEIIAITYQAADYRDKETRVFAFLGVPKTASESNPVPAAVLVHGGGGTADAFWVKYWVDRGYAAISMDLEGHYPVKNSGYYLPGTEKNDYSGPVRNGAFGDAGLKDISRQWPYQAVSDIMIARTILGAMPQVRDDAVGIMGFSWGGYLTSFTIGVDNRFAFAIPVYGSAYLTDNFGTATKGKAAKWESSLNIDNVTAKVLWFNSDKDAHFAVSCTSLSYENTADSTLLIDPDLAHGGGNCWSRPEQFILADSVTKGTPGLIKITQQPSGLNPTVKYSLPDGVTVHSAKVYYRDASMGWKDTVGSEWKSMDCTVNAASNTVTVSLPADTVVYYINVYDNRTEKDLFMNKIERIGVSTKVVYLSKD